MSTARTGRPASPQFPSVLPETVEERIRVRAYELFLQRGAEHGRALDDWLQAETEIIRQSLRVVPPRDATRKARAKKAST